MDPSEKNPPSLPADMRQDGHRYVNLRDEAPMVWIPEGPFYMGQPKDEIFAKPHERPGRTVLLLGYFIDLYPVTNRQFSLFVQDGGYDDQKFWSKAGWEWVHEKKIKNPVGWEHDEFKRGNHPVAGVSWYEADAYARWANKRLPSEAEWEKAARGTDGRRFPWGNGLPTPSITNFDNRKRCTTEVGAYPEGASPYGCQDMSGNVNNWCQDWYWESFYAWCVKKDLNTLPLLDDKLAASLKIPKELKVDRGGGYATAFQYLEVLSCTDKVAWPPMARNLWNGFRCVKDIVKIG
jgi:formylglycine-generating enzyme required for sulfatase activity